MGKDAGDIYGRQIGRIIGFDRNPYGELEGVQVEAPGGNILTFKAAQVALTPKTITLTPEWKVECKEVISELTVLRKRVEALESMNTNKEMDGDIYEEILEAQKSGYLERVKKAEALASSMKSRLVQITAQISSLTKYLVNAKLDTKSGVMDESALKIARESIEPGLKPLIAEKNDLLSKLKSLEQVLPARVTLG